jgi:Protein of unknown function (DUF3089)
MFNRTMFILFLISLLGSCSDKYLSYTRHYTFKSDSRAPDYNDLDYWAAHPWKWDPSDSVPAPLIGPEQDSIADLFFLYPTTFTDPGRAKMVNAPIDDPYLSAKTDYSTILFQASAFNQHCRIFSPRYRQAHLSNFYSNDTATSGLAFDLAYQDIKSAFEFYLRHYNAGRPIIIAAHSQGSKLAERLLKEFFDGRELQEKLVAAYVLGWPIPRDYFGTLKMCADSLETGCLCG